MAVKTNALQLAVRFEALGPGVQAQVVRELDLQAQLVAQLMRKNAPKFQSVLTNSIHVERPSATVRVIAPGVDYAQAQEFGIKPGGKGLPRFSDSGSAAIVAWLQTKMGGAPNKRATKKRQAFELELRDRYEGLAWHIRRRGMKASPFVRPTFDQKVGSVAAALKAAVARGLAAQGAQGGAA